MATDNYMRFERLSVETQHRIAYESPDHLQPWGTARDNSRNLLFNEKLYRLYASLARPLRILDLGCSGGGFVRDCINDGCIAVGLEGSDYSLRMGRAEWALGGNRFLFTSDITKEFTIAGIIDGTKMPVQFDVVTAWEVLEHIATSDLPMVMENVRRHLLPGSILVMSISTQPEIINGVNLHQTVRPQRWWLRRFTDLGFRNCPDLVNYFNNQYIRGPKQGAAGSFNVVLTTGAVPPLIPPRLSKKRRIYEAWVGSRPQRIAQRLLFPGRS